MSLQSLRKYPSQILSLVAAMTGQSVLGLASQIAEQEKVQMSDWKEAQRPLADLKGLSYSWSSTDGLQVQWLISIRESTAFLHEKWGEFPRGPIPTAYLSSLRLDSDLLREVFHANESEPDDQQKEHIDRVLQNIAEDLAIKASHCKTSAKGWASLIWVDINTLRMDGSVVKGLEVWYVPLGWADVKDRWLRCLKLSSPASVGQLAPGKYMIRVEGGESVPVKIGGDGKEKQGVDLRVG